MLEFFSIEWRFGLRARGRRPNAGGLPSCQSADLLAHPAIAAMSERELADLPFPRNLCEGRAPRPQVARHGPR